MCAKHNGKLTRTQYTRLKARTNPQDRDALLVLAASKGWLEIKQKLTKCGRYVYIEYAVTEQAKKLHKQLTHGEMENGKGRKSDDA
jgi:hypothetical protein